LKEEFTVVDDKKEELKSVLKKVSKKPFDMDRKEESSEVILQVLNDIKKDLHLVTIIILIWFIFFLINLILMFAFIGST
jgi:hypothetical protein